MEKEDVARLMERIRAAYADRLNGVEAEVSFVVEVFAAGDIVERRRACGFRETLEEALLRFARDAEGAP